MDDKLTVSFAGATIVTTVTHLASVVSSWISNVYSTYSDSEIMAGLDCKWRPNTSFSKSNRTATLQLCVDNTCLIIQLFHIDYIPKALKNFLSDDNVVLLGVEIGRDARKIRCEYGLTCKRVVDVKREAMDRWPGSFRGRPGLKDVAYKVLGLRMSKSENFSPGDWQARFLDSLQIKSACIDTYASYRIGKKLFHASNSA